MEEELPEEVDIAVVGTGLAASIYACEYAKKGSTVLHVDSEREYGGDHRGYSLEELKSHRMVTSFYLAENGESVFKGEKIELSPFLFHTDSLFAEKIMANSVDRHIVLQSIDSVGVIQKDRDSFECISVPCSGEDVCGYDEGERAKLEFLLEVKDIEPETESFEDFIDSFRFTEKTKNIVVYGMCLFSCEEAYREASTAEGLHRLYLFGGSIGRGSKTPFVYSLYGAADISRGFCRRCAVYGGTYVLGQGVKFYGNKLLFGEAIVTAHKTFREKEAEEEVHTVILCYEEPSDRGSRLVFVPLDTFQGQKSVVTLTAITVNGVYLHYIQTKHTDESSELLDKMERVVSFDSHARLVLRAETLRSPWWPPL
ncbi:MAG: Rab GDP-dissociation inhibitor [Amphiamblys sp. WSBS2006]|nr:MAG: Rab GDP-dissociation inhibitor [Amphiamblys sp. WSBS2006]